MSHMSIQEIVDEIYDAMDECRCEAYHDGFEDGKNCHNGHAEWRLACDGYYYCDKCLEQALWSVNRERQLRTRYCYNCGARMDGGKDAID